MTTENAEVSSIVLFLVLKVTLMYTNHVLFLQAQEFNFEVLKKKIAWGWRDGSVVRAYTALSKDLDFIPGTQSALDLL